MHHSRIMRSGANLAYESLLFSSARAEQPEPAAASASTATRPSDRSDLTFADEYLTDLQTWTGSGVTVELTTDTGTAQAYRARVAKAAAPTNVFFRLRVTR